MHWHNDEWSLSIFIYYHAEYRYAECRYAECHYAKCRYAEYRSTYLLGRDMLHFLV